ncbi:S9 family peptidase [Aestuariibaculum suncheonense]|uniref:DPP IV N-terminal domain-containing protein n=1 Tax=Aestuariibaculum suncheonense TaxID=1028745 RepID=A0A8J6Q8W2_9FLAO|nr:DPP IV N-terminal domain-containing protein [Aestuariibaculum suncheonense]MBD0836224.1 DPP IV N-terminal domain-containing protein [Aestuariibaculum suncheonense]
MKKITLFFLLAILANISFSQENQENLTPTPNYKLATKFSPYNLAKMVHSTEVKPMWLEHGNRFWYQYKTTEGSNYYIVDADKRTKKKLFDNAKMAKWLTEITKDPYDAKHLPRFDFEFVDNDTAIRFKLTSNEEVEVVDEKAKKETDSTQTDSTKAKKEKKKAPKMEKKKYYLEYKLGSDGLTVLEYEKDKKEPWKTWANVSPDSTVVLFSKNHNLYWMDKENFLKLVKDEKDTTVVENQWTKDGERYFGYGGSNKEEENDSKPADTTKREAIHGYWSHDSKKFVFQKTDSRHIKDLWVINSVDKGRPTLETYKYHMAGEPEFYKTDLLIFDMPSKEITTVQLDSTVQQTIGIYTHQYKKADKSEHKPRLLLSKKNKVYFNTVSRDRKRLDIHVADLNTGEVKTLIEDHFNTYVDKKDIVLFNNETEILHWSERDGWGHFYLYDANGTLKNQVTTGEFHVDDFKGIDEKTRTVYFIANGVNKDQDPYYQHLYKVNLNGSGFKCLNEGDYDNAADLADSNLYFVNNYSRVDTTPKSELRNSNGKVILELEEADLSQLMAAGYKFPEPFKLKAADGITDLYGVMYKPYDFDETKKYPILEYVYPGPQTEAVDKSFSVSMHNTARMAQVGFIVVTVGNRGGHPARSKWYHTYGYGNLRDYGLEDKKYVAEQLADKYNYIDIDKVGIYGHSGGGFMSTAAMMVYPDFFKVAVSSAGNHDNTIYNSWWSETHHGIKEVIGAEDKISYKYNIDKNQSLVKNLKGKLMLVTGDIDNNVHPASTIRVADALIKANKRFDFMVMPGQRHSFGRMYEYFFWLKADYFSKHFLGVEATSTDITEMNIDIARKY